MVETRAAGLTFQHKVLVRRHISSVLSEIRRHRARSSCECAARWYCTETLSRNRERCSPDGRHFETRRPSWRTVEIDFGATVAWIACNDATQALVGALRYTKLQCNSWKAAEAGCGNGSSAHATVRSCRA